MVYWPIGGAPVGGGPAKHVSNPFMIDLPQVAFRPEILITSGSIIIEISTRLPHSPQVWDQQRELDEFVQSAKLYRPLNSAMANRFAHGSGEPSKTLSFTKAGEDPEPVKDARKNAVKMKLFGNLTRERYEWHPATLMCKRFDMPDPYPKSGLVGLVRSARQMGGIKGFLASAKEASAMQAAQALPTAFGSSSTQMPPPQGYGLAPPTAALAASKARLIDPVPSVPVAKLPPRPAMDIFKAIFNDSSSSDDSDDADDAGAADTSASASTNPTHASAPSSNAGAHTRAPMAIATVPTHAAQPMGMSTTGMEPIGPPPIGLPPAGGPPLGTTVSTVGYIPSSSMTLCS